MVEEENLFKMMVPTAGPFSAHKNARYIVRMAKKLRAHVIVIHIRDKGESREGGDEALDIFNEEAKRLGIQIERIPAIGEVSQTIIELARFHEVDLIVMGATRGRSVSHWIIETIINKTDIPVVLIPWNYEVSQTDPIQIEKVQV